MDKGYVPVLGAHGGASAERFSRGRSRPRREAAGSLPSSSPRRTRQRWPLSFCAQTTSTPSGSTGADAGGPQACIASSAESRIRLAGVELALEAQHVMQLKHGEEFGCAPHDRLDFGQRARPDGPDPEVPAAQQAGG